MAKYVVDIDGILCENSHYTNYSNAIPIRHNIDHVNNLYSQGHFIQIFTSRLNEDKKTTINWLINNKVKYNEITFEKPTADYYIDDKSNLIFPKQKLTRLCRLPLVICYSGGLDSYTAYHYALKNGFMENDILLLNFDVGSSYADKEKSAMKKLDLPYTTIPIPILKGLNTTKSIIPNRNSIFANIAAMFGDCIWIVGIKDENHYLMFDKNNLFYKTATMALTQSCGTKTVVDSPFKNWSKTQVMQWAIDNISPCNLQNTVSCYHPTLQACGECDPCFKRYISGKTIDYIENFSKDPSTSDVAKFLIQEYKQAILTNDFSHYSKERIKETFLAMGIASNEDF